MGNPPGVRSARYTRAKAEADYRFYALYADQPARLPGSPISPLLANLYMRRFVLGWKKLGLQRRLGTRLVTLRTTW